MTKKLLVGVGLSLILSVWLWQAATAQEVVLPFETAECPFPIPIGYRIDCGYVSVPEDRAQPNSPQIKIGVALVHSRAAQPAPDPIFFLNGGPGGALIAALPNMLSGFDPMLSVRDVVFFDQRGAGWSQPSLVCPETAEIKIEALQGKQFSLEESLTPYLACRDRLQGAGVNVAVYNTTENAADVDDLRRALGYEQINLFGVSYGTMLAQVIVRDYADYIRSAVLDSAYPIWEYVMADAPASLMHYLDTIFANCANDFVCRTAYPDLPTVFAQLADRVRQQPIVFSNSDPITQEAFTTTIDHVGLIGWLIYTNPRQVPGLIYDLRDGEVASIVTAQQAMLKEAYRPQWPLSEGMKTTVLCQLRLAQVTPQQMIESNARDATAPWANATNAANMALCAQWPTRPIDAREATRLQTEVPLLVIGGEYDAGSPPRYAETIAAASDHGYAFVVPEAGHAALISADPCANGIVYSFLNDPLRKPQSECLKNTRHPGFSLRAALSRPVITLLSMALLGVLGWSGWRGMQSFRRQPHGGSWRISWRLLGWWPVVASAALVGLALLTSTSDVTPLSAARCVETIVPLLAAVQAAFLFSPEDEPGLEVTLACRRPLAWTILERLMWLLLAQGSVALIGSSIAVELTGENFGVAIARWLAPLLVLVGIALCLTLMTRLPMMSLGLVVILWSGLMLASEQLIGVWPFLWPIGLYLQPEQPDYWPNRIFLILIGLWLIRLAVTYFIRDEERVLLGGRSKSRSGPRLRRAREEQG
jgi:pimeloyl-ACP methyl ester carboxylesterase